MLLLYKHSKELECNILFTFQIFNFFSRTAILHDFGRHFWFHFG